jgi:putative nucleotidyltransferase with HDIG domain
MNSVLAQLHEITTADEAHRLADLADLADRLELKEGYAGDHTTAVSRLAVEIAAALGLDEEERRRVALGALLHDVGKLSVPDRILTKPGPLDDLEWAAMRRHAAFGERLLVHILDLPDVLAVVRSHHERWDGTGYPDGKHGEEIPLAARIVAVADAFHAMIEPRPYRAARPHARALGEIVAEAGAQFDPACVDALLTVIENAGNSEAERK